MRQAPVVEIPIFNHLKRKRTGSPEPLSAADKEDVKRRKVLNSEVPTPRRPSDAANGLSESKSATTVASSTASQLPRQTGASQHLPAAVNSGKNSNAAAGAPPNRMLANMVADGKSVATDISQPSKLQQAIEHQFNLEILLKHRELRLIEQELAKCQVALEQLRRCELMPYPGATGLSESLSAGTGPALKPQPGFTQPSAPAPWGVTDGPYTRHYAKWLLNDPTFDSMPFHQVISPGDTFAATEGRSTRNSSAGLGKASKTRSTRDSIGNLSQALPNYPLQPRGKGGPLVIKRMADNQFVKLICNNCQRGDFSSVQGFLNHCRIAHKVDYKSHEAAAADCGRLLEDYETHLIPQGQPPSASTAKTPAPKMAPPAIHHTAAFVHPLNAPILPRNTWKRQSLSSTAHSSMPMQKPHPEASRKRSISSAASSFHASPLVASLSTPYLSAQFAKRGLGGDLQRATSQAREKIDLGIEAMDEDESAASSRKNSIFQTNSLTPTSSQLERPQSRKAHRQPIARPRPAPLAPQPATALRAVETPDSPQDLNLSPHTADSNPGLVSDHEDDDAASELDEAHSERHHSPDPAPVSALGGIRGSTCGADAMDVDIEVEDDGDGHGVLIRPRSLALQDLRAAAGSPSRPVSRYGEAAK
ncbi:hypothetical protein MBLNU459_g6271t1 [Dothideomycetes sp. NU459]